LALIGEVPSSSAASSSDQPLSKTGFPSLLASLKSEMNDSSDEDEDDGTTNNAETTLGDILAALVKAEERIMDAIRNNMHITKVKNFVYDDDGNQTSSTDICFYIM
jgi:hypothetical protein